jgi:hypothetical protein
VPTSRDTAAALLADSGIELERAVRLAEDPSAEDQAVLASARRAAGLAVRGILLDRGIVAARRAGDEALPALLRESGLRPPAGVEQLLLGGGVDRTAAVTAAMAAVTWSAASRYPVVER